MKRVFFQWSFLIFCISFCKISWSQIRQQPTGKSICHSITDSLQIISNSNDSFQWQDSTSTGWQNISNNSPYLGFNSSRLFIQNSSPTLQILYLRCIVDSANLNLRKDTSTKIAVTLFPNLNRSDIDINNATRFICNNTRPDTIKFNTFPTGGNGNFSHQWQSSNNGVNFTDILSANSIFFRPNQLTSATYYRVVSNSAVGCGTVISDTVLISVFSPLIKPQIGQNQSICNSTSPNPISLTQNATGANGIFTYQWQSSNNGSNWNNIIGANANSFTPGSLNSSTYYRIVAISTFGCGSIASDSVFINVYAPLTSGIIGNNHNICYNGNSQTIRFNNQSTGANNNYSYQWQESIDSINFSNLANQNGNTLNTNNLTQTKFYRLQTISNLGCGTVNSNIVRVLVYPNLGTSDIDANNAPRNICYNSRPDTIRFNVFPSGGNGIFTHQWQSSTDGINFSNIPGVTAIFYRPNPLTSSTYFRVISTSTFGCGSIVSDSVHISVYQPLTKPNIGQSQSICYNTSPNSILLNQGASGADGNFNYQWQSSSNRINWSNITGTSPDSLVIGNLTSSTYFRIVAISTFGCGSISSDSVFINVYAPLTSGIIGNNHNICYNGNSQTIRFINPSTGANNNYAYQWQESNDSLSFSDLVNQTRDTLKTFNLTSTKFYRLQTISNLGCGTVNSNIVRVLVYPNLGTSDIDANNAPRNICYNTRPDTIRFNVFPSGGNGIFTHQWQSSTNGINFSNIPGATAIFYRPNPLTISTYYRVISTSTFGCGFIVSDSVYINVFQPLTKPSIGQSQSICYNTSPNAILLNQGASGADGNFNYQWQSSSNRINWNNITGTIPDSLVIGNLTSSTYYRIVAISTFGCGSIASDSVFINVYAPLTSGIIGNNHNICYNGNSQTIRFNNPSTGANNNYAYQWQESNDSLSFSDLVNQTRDTLKTFNLTSTKFYRLQTISILGCGTVNSNIVRVLVYPRFMVGSIGNDDTVCYNFTADTLRTINNSTGGTSVYSYQWLKSNNGINWIPEPGANLNQFLPLFQKTTTFYKLKVTSSFGCGTDSTNAIKILVNPLPDTASILGPRSVCRNHKDNLYKRNTSNNNFSYQWSSSLGNIQYGKNEDSCFIWWGNVSGLDTLRLQQTNKITGCENVMKIPITISSNRAPDTTNIIRKVNSNILICDDQTPGLTYQWGYIQKSTKIATNLPGATLRYVQLPFTFDTTQHIYYVITSNTGCNTISYYNYTIIPVGSEDFETIVPTVNIYPNPTKGQFIISGIDSNCSIQIFDVNGKKVNFYWNRINNEIQMDENIVPGIYYLRIQSKLGSIVKKIILWN